jgi:ABC-type lipoprotein release transport system permease subunit
VLLGTAALVALLGLSRGIQAQLLRSIGEQAALTLVQVLPGPPRPGRQSARVLDAPAVRALGTLPGVRSAAPVVVVPATLRAGDRAPTGNVLGISPPDEPPYALQSGRVPDPRERDAALLTPAGLRGLGGDPSAVLGGVVSVEVRRGPNGPSSEVFRRASLG